MTDQGQRHLSVSEAVEITGLRRRTLQRRLDAWLNGDRSPYAIRCGRTGGNRGDRLVDPLDAQRVRKQVAGELQQNVTAEQYARKHPEQP